MANPYKDYSYVLMNTQTGESREHSVALQDDEAFVHWLAQQNSQAPQGWMFVRPEDVKKKGF